MQRRRVLALPAALLAALAALTLGCGSPCQDLGTRICLCQPPGAVRDNCRSAVSDQIGKGNPKPGKGEQDFCADRLDHCPEPSKDAGMCDRLLTEQGKIDCGLAFPPQ